MEGLLLPCAVLVRVLVGEEDSLGLGSRVALMVAVGRTVGVD